LRYAYGSAPPHLISPTADEHQSMSRLPRLLPDFNPIENASAKHKAMLRNADARNIADLWDAIRNALPLLTPVECRNEFIIKKYQRNEKILLF
jgi:transposase